MDAHYPTMDQPATSPDRTQSEPSNPCLSPATHGASNGLTSSDEIMPPETAEPRWGFWATVGLSLVVAGVFLGIQTAVAIGFVIAKLAAAGGTLDPTAIAALKSNGLLLGLATLVSVPPSVGLIALFAKLKRGATVRGYLGLHGVTPGVAGRWIAVMLVYFAATDGLTYTLGRRIVSQFMVEAYTTAGFLPLLWIALVVLAPLFEETFFRGFLLEGLRLSRVGPIGAVTLTSLVWASAHLQYDAYQMGIIFAGGLLLGTVKLRTGSTFLTIALHALQNVIATLEAVVYLHSVQ